MALTVETGSGSSSADALDTLANVDAYHTARGNTAWTGADALKEAAIRRASAFLSSSFTWQGLRTHGRDQSLAWPRSGVVDREGYGILSDTIPIEVRQAVAEIALRELVTPGSMTPDFSANALAKREKVGEIEVEYALADLSPAAARPVLLIVNDLIGQFLAKGSASASITGLTYR